MPNSKAKFVRPMLLQLVHELPAGAQWEYEVKWDGYRGIAVLNHGQAQLFSRNGKDLAKRFPAIPEALGQLKVKNAVLDGELVVLDAQGKPSFQSLQYFDPKNEGMLCYYAFDLLHLDGKDLAKKPLVKRRELLQELLLGSPALLRFSSTLRGDPDDLVPLLRDQGLEGIVAKQKESVYEAGKRSGKWQKLKLNQEEEFLIGGFIPSGRRGVESVVLGIQEKDQLRYVGTLDVSMPPEQSRSLALMLDEISTAKCPFGKIPERKPGNSWSGGMTSKQKSSAIWIQPKLTAEVTFLEWTRGGFLRHAQVKRLPTIRDKA